MSKRWYIVHAYSNFEHRVKAVLEERIERYGLEDKFGEILVPTEEVVEMREGQKRRSERKFFPGYVLVNMEMDDETWHLVKEVPKVLGFIGGSSDRPAPITEKEANNILPTNCPILKNPGFVRWTVVLGTGCKRGSHVQNICNDAGLDACIRS